jgi:hypothetical protein
MSSKRREYKVDDRAKKAAVFFLFRACEANPDTRLSIPAAMRAKGYLDVKAADRILVQQVRHESQKKTPKDTPRPKPVAASSLLALSTTANVRRAALAPITSVPVAGSVLPAAGVDALPLPPRKTQKTSHQEQIARQNERKHRAVHGQAHAHAITLVAKERAKEEKENRRMTAEVIEQVKGEFRALGFPVTLSKPTINRYVTLNMIDAFPLARGYEGAMPHAAFELCSRLPRLCIRMQRRWRWRRTRSGVWSITRGARPRFPSSIV